MKIFIQIVSSLILSFFAVLVVPFLIAESPLFVASAQSCGCGIWPPCPSGTSCVPVYPGEGCEGTCEPVQVGGGACEVDRSCPPGTYADWSTVTYGCGHWGKVCGDAVVRGGSAVCSCCTWSCYHVPKKNTVCEWECPTPCKQSSVTYATCRTACSATAPSNVSVTSLTYTSSRVTWTPGTGGSSQRIYIGANRSEVEANCPGTSSPACAVAETNLSSSQGSFDTGEVLAAGTIYYYRVVNYNSVSCSTPSSTATKISSCFLSPSSLSLKAGESALVTSSAASSGDIQRVSFSETTGDVSVNPASDTSYPYSAEVTGMRQTNPSTTLTSSVYLASDPSNPACTATIPVSVLPQGPWWEVVDGDVSASGNLSSAVPIGFVFDETGLGGYPGVPVYSGVSSFGDGTVSDTSWIAESNLSQSRIFDYKFFEKQVPDDIAVTTITTADIPGDYFTSQGSQASDGFFWFKFDGTAGSTLNQNLNITSGISLGDRKVILLVKGADLNIGGSISLTDGSGFFLAAVNGGISVDPTVGGGLPDLEGLYVSDGVFSTGTNGADLDIPLHIRGSAASYGGMFLLRDLSDDSSIPAETFEYAPDQILLFPKKLAFWRIHWKEVAP